MITRLIYGRQTSEVYNRIIFLRDVVGWWEDLTIVKMGGPGKVVEGDGMFILARENVELVVTTVRNMFMFAQNGPVERFDA